ncbi:MAG TPA: tetratricopeptide repeat protein [Steroidobacteraceae bacterium]|nr:tetratricopeptide repeat protein [Steroidobacteraceae bacterium]
MTPSPRHLISPLRLAAAAAALLAGALGGCQTAPPAKAQAQTPQDPSAQTVVAEIALQRGDCRAASEAYASAASHGNAALARRASQVAFACEDLPAAWQAAQRWHALAPADREASIIYATVALKLYRIGDARTALAPVVRNGAVQDDKEAVQKDKDLIALIDVLAQESDSTATLAALDDTLDAHGSSARVLTALGDLALNAYDFNRAERHAREALERATDDPQALRLITRVRTLRGDADGAILGAREVMRVAGADGTFELADVLTELDRTEEARQELERLRANQASPEEIDRRLALIAYQSGDLAEARRRFSELIDRGEATDAAVFYLADIANRTGDADAALAAYRQLSDSPMALSARERAAGILIDRGKRGEALDLLDSYESEHPESGFDLALAKAQVLADHGDPKAGVGVLTDAMQRFPDNPSIEYERATMLERAGQLNDSIKAFERLMIARPNDPNLQNALGYTLADHGLQLSRAEGLIRRALAVTPDNPAVLDSLAWVRVRRGDARGALPTLERAYTISRDAEIAAHWGEALWLAGAHDQAREVLATALARNPDSAALKATLNRLMPAEPPSAAPPPAAPPVLTH